MWLYAFVLHQSFLAGISQIAASLPATYENKGNYTPRLYGPLPSFPTSGVREATVTQIENSIAKKLRDASVLKGLLPVDHLVAIFNQSSWLLLGLGFIASLLVFVLRWLPAVGQALCYTALAINAYFLGTALAQPAIPRYPLPMQGSVLAMLLLAAVLAIVCVRKIYISNRERLLRGFTRIFHLGSEQNAT